MGDAVGLGVVSLHGWESIILGIGFVPRKIESESILFWNWLLEKGSNFFNFQFEGFISDFLGNKMSYLRGINGLIWE